MRVRIDRVEQVGTVTARPVDDRIRQFDCARFLATNRHAKDFFRQSAEYRYNLQSRLERTVTHLLEAGELGAAERFLTDFDVLAARIALEASPQGVIEDLTRLEGRLSSNGLAEVQAIRRALELAVSVVAFARDQLPEQMLARLGPTPTQGRVGRLRQRAIGYKTEPWFRPLRASLEGPESPLDAILGFQDELIAGACFDPHSGCLLTVGDSELIAWDLAGRKALVRVRLKDASPTAVACRGQLAAVTTREGPVLIIELTTGRRLKPLPGHDRATLDGAFIPDGRLVTVGTDAAVRIWNVRDCKDEARLETGDLTPHCVVSLYGGRIAVGCDPEGDGGGSIQIWDVQTRTLLTRFGQHSWPVDCLAVSDDGTALAAGANDELTVWSLPDGTCLGRIRTPHTKCHALAFVGPGLLLSGDSSGELRLWSVDSGEQVRRLPSHSGLVSAVRVAPSRAQFVTTSWDQSVRVWNVVRLKEPQPLGHDQQVTALAFYPDESRIVSGSHDGTLIIWDTQNGCPLSDLRGHGHWISSVWVGNVILSASWDGTFRAWDIDTLQPLCSVATGDEHVTLMAVTEGGARVATVSPEGVIRAWNRAEGKQVATTTSPEKEIRSIAFLDGGARLRWGTHRNRVYDWFMDDAVPAETALPGGVPATTWDLNERAGLSVLGFANGAIMLFDCRGTPVAEFGVEGCGPAAVVRSQDGALLLAAGGLPQLASDNTARLWRTTNPEKPVAVFLGDAPFTTAALSRDGRLAVLGDAMGAVHFLEVVGA